MTNNLKWQSFPVGSFQCNCTVIYSEKTKEAVVIDPGNDPRPVTEFLKKHSLHLKDMIHTHAHFDHIGRSNSIKASVGGNLWLHKGDTFLYEGLKIQERFAFQEVDEPKALDGYLEDGQEFKIKTEEDDSLTKVTEVIHTPGHTPGSCSFYSTCFGSPVLFTGDTLFLNSIGRTDLPGGDSQLLLKSIKNRILPLPEETLIVPGHGPTTILSRERRSNPFLV